MAAALSPRGSAKSTGLVTVKLAEGGKDHLGITQDSSFASYAKRIRSAADAPRYFCLLDPGSIHEEIFFSQRLLKVNRKGQAQQRVLVVSLTAIYNFKVGSYSAPQRRIPLFFLDQVLRISDTNDVVLHFWEHSLEYDYRWRCESKESAEELVQALSGAFLAGTASTLTEATLSESEVKALMITKAAVKAKAAVPSPAIDAAVSRRHSHIASVLGKRFGLSTDEAARSGSAAERGGRSGTFFSFFKGGGQAAAGSPTLTSTGTSSEEVDVAALVGDGEKPLGHSLHSPPLFTALMDMVRAVAKRISDANDSNKELADLMSRSRKTDSMVDSSRFIAELLVSPENTDDVQYWCKKKGEYATVLLDGASHCALYWKDASVRGWGTRALWSLLVCLRQAAAKQAHLEQLGGFQGIVLAGFSLHSPAKPVEALAEPVYLALLEILLGDISRPSDGRGRVEPFGREIKNPAAMPVIMRTACSAPWPLRRDVVKDFNIMLVKREENFSWILRQKGWPSWLAPLLHDCPRSASGRTDMQKDFLKYAVNLFCMLLQHIFTTKDSIARTINRLCAQLELQVGWGPPAVAVMRVLLGNLLSKVASSAKRWKDSAESKQWQALLALLSAVEDFIFYRPCVSTDALALEREEAHDVVLPLPAELARPGAAQPVVEDANTVGVVDRSRVGLHLNDKGEAEDTKLAERAVKLLQDLGFTGDMATSTALDFAKGRAAKDIISNGNALCKAFNEIVELAKGVTASAAGSEEQQEASTRAIGAFLERRQKQNAGSFFSAKTGNKKQLTKALKSSMQRAQAQMTIRRQVRSKVQKAQAAITVSDEILADSTGRAAAEAADTDVRGGTAKRLRGAGSGQGEGGAAAGEAGDDLTAQGNADGVSNNTPCHRCSQPLLSDDGMEANGRQYHERCFSCSVCAQPLAGVPYYESKGVLFCKAHYMERFGRSICAGCLAPFKRGDAAIEACDKLWHLDCFKCGHCESPFEVDAEFFEKDDLPYCSTCNTKLFLTCPVCKLPISETDAEGISALGRNYHGPCFNCFHCHRPFEGSLFFAGVDAASKERKPYCEEHYCELFLPKCMGCTEPLKEDGLTACGSAWHADCFKCTVCGSAFGDGQYFDMDGLPYCESDYNARFSNKCAACGEYISGEEFLALGKSWHPDHFVCAHTGAPLGEVEFLVKDGKPYTREAYQELFGNKCKGCGEIISEGELKACGFSWHAHCLVDGETGERITDQATMGPDGKVYTTATYAAKFGKACSWCGESLGTEAPIVLKPTADAEGEERHAACCRCSDPLCPSDLTKHPFKVTEHGPLCSWHMKVMFAPRCDYCGDPIEGGKVNLMELTMHSDCMKCWSTGVSLSGQQIFKFEGVPVVKAALDALKPKCVYCGKAIDGAFVNLQGSPAHQDCVGCFITGDKFEGGQFYMRDGIPVCKKYAGSFTDLPEGTAEKWAVNKAAAEASMKGKATLQAKVEQRRKDVAAAKAQLEAVVQRIKTVPTTCSKVRGGWLVPGKEAPVPVDAAWQGPPGTSSSAAAGGAAAGGPAPPPAHAAAGAGGGSSAAPPAPATAPSEVPPRGKPGNPPPTAAPAPALPPSTPPPAPASSPPAPPSPAAKTPPGAPPRPPPAPSTQPSAAKPQSTVHVDVDNTEQDGHGYTKAQRDGLPQPWVRVLDDSGETYFFHTESGEALWEPPPGSAPGADYWPADKAGLPLGWTRVKDDAGDVFFRDFLNDTAQYEAPSAPAPGALDAFAT